MIKPCAIIFGCLAIGEFIVWALGLTFPGSIVGMLILTALLELKVVKLEWVKGMSDFLVENIGFFFIPPGVAFMLYIDLIKAELWSIVVATLVSTIIVLLITGWTHQILRNRKEDKEDGTV